MDNLRHCIVATAGHVDHGKSTLVRALTGIDPDRLPEEKKRGITIDLGFAHFDLPSPAGSTLRIGIVDVPGHEDFVKNMVAGVGAVDAALFVVAADDGWMPQTEEHLWILDYLGVRQAVVALTKADLVSPSQLDATTFAVRQQLAGSALADVMVLPICAPTGGGVEGLRTELARVLSAASPARDLGKPRLPIDRVFTLRGIGTVVTGTLTGGTLARGQTIVALPSIQTGRIRAVQSYQREVELGQPGSRVALNLPGLAAESLHRGQVVTLAGLAQPSDTLDVLLVRATRTAGSAPDSAMKNEMSVRLHLGTSSHAARLHLLDAMALGPGERALAQLRFFAPSVVAFAGDRFVLRDASGRATLAGGTVLDPHAPRRGGRAADRRELLARRAAAPDRVEVFLATELAVKRVVPRKSLLVQSHFSAAEIDDALHALHAVGRCVLNPTLAADGLWWQATRCRAAALVDGFHQAHPERAGLPLPELQRALFRTQRTPAKWSDALIADLQTTSGGGFVVNHTVIRRAAHRLTLPSALLTSAARVRAALLAKPFEPASRADLAPDASTQSALLFLLETGEAVELSKDIVLSVGAFVRLRAAITRHLQSRGAATTSELRQLLGTTRRILVPLLEQFDRQGLTRREGDLRVLAEPLNAQT